MTATGFFVDWDGAPEGLNVPAMVTRAVLFLKGKQIMKKSKPEGRLAKRMAFYALNRRKAQGRSVLRQLRAALPAKAEQQAVDSLSTVYGDEWEAPTFDAFRARARN